MRRRGLTREQAVAELHQIARDDAEFPYQLSAVSDQRSAG
jgi:hypothetical protein